MKVFISWSNQPSGHVAEVLREWLPLVLQQTQPFYSPNDIAKGTHWASEIGQQLQDTRVGLICVTSNNLTSPWLMFEAGSLAKEIEASRVCPLLFGVTPAHLTGPLAQFQAAPFDKVEWRRVIRMMNDILSSQGLSQQVLDRTFEQWWPDLERDIQQAMLATPPDVGPPTRSERELLEEILTIVRLLPPSSSARSLPAEALMELLTRYNRLVEKAEQVGTIMTLRDEMMGVSDMLAEYVIAYGGGMVGPSLRQGLMEAREILSKYPGPALREIADRGPDGLRWSRAG